MARVLLVDDRPDTRRSLSDLLTSEGHEVQAVPTVPDALAQLRMRPRDLVLSDVRIEAEDDGLVLLRIVRRQLPDLAVILYTAFARVDHAVLAMKRGADDYLEFPIDSDRLLVAISSALKRRGATGSSPALASPPRETEIVAASASMRAVLAWITRIAPKDVTVLIEGETGTGKELLARSLHDASERRHRPFVPVNCGAIPDTLFEAELFGYRKGAFTGAVNDKPGLIEAAHGGTLLLDEVGELPAAMQVRLLRVLEDGEIRRLGDTQARHVDVRIVAATNRVLREEAAQGRFRLDLFFRLSTAVCRIPPLRERLDDLQALVEYWLPRLAERLSLDVRRVTPAALTLMQSHTWPGNVRELRNALEHAAILATGDAITEREVGWVLGTVPRVAVAADADTPGERDVLLTTLSHHQWRIGRAARSLGVSRSTLWRRLKRHGIRLRDQKS